ncbi:hypothetical protein BH10BAC5_BH10BAC5_05660 [soil metagenome]
MVIFSLFILVLAAILLIAVVMLQSSKGNGLSGTFGGSGMASAFGARRTSDFLTRTTTILAVVFLLGSLALNLYVTKSGSGVSESIIQKNAGSQQLPPPTSTQPPVNNSAPPVDNNAPVNTDQSNQPDVKKDVQKDNSKK